MANQEAPQWAIEAADEWIWRSTGVRQQTRTEVRQLALVIARHWAGSVAGEPQKIPDGGVPAGWEQNPQSAASSGARNTRPPLRNEPSGVNLDDPETWRGIEGAYNQGVAGEGQELEYWKTRAETAELKALTFHREIAELRRELKEQRGMSWEDATCGE